MKNVDGEWVNIDNAVDAKKALDEASVDVEFEDNCKGVITILVGDWYVKLLELHEGNFWIQAECPMGNVMLMGKNLSIYCDEDKEFVSMGVHTKSRLNHLRMSRNAS